MRARAWTISLLAAALVSQTPAAVATADIKEDTRLSIGDRAVVTYEMPVDKVRGPIGITVARIEKGKRSDLSGLRLPDSAKGMTPYYIRWSVAHRGTDFRYLSLALGGLYADGSRAGTIVTSNLAKCKPLDTSRGFTAGKPYRACTAVLAPRGAKIAGAEYIGYTPRGSERSTFTVTWQ